MEPSNKYYHKTKNIANKHGRSIEIFPEDYRVNDEEKYGCEVEHVYFNSYEELMTTLQTGGNKTIDAVVLRFDGEKGSDLFDLQSFTFH